MKILKIAGIVAGIHAFFLILIFAIPGCSSTTKPPPEPVDTVQSAPAPTITVPAALTAGASASAATPAAAPTPLLTPPPTGFNPDAPASYSDSSPMVHFTPTRPNSPAASALLTQPVADVTPAATYTVKSGDSLWILAKKNHLTAPELAAANNLRPNTILQPGQKLIIPSKAGSSSATTRTIASTPSATGSLAGSNSTPAKSNEPAAAPKGSADDLKHVVKSGETLSEIAKKYGVKTSVLAEKNNIADPAKLRPGTELVIPGWNSTSGKSSKGTTSADRSSKSSGASTTSTSSTTEPEAPPAAAPQVPVIHIDDNPITPAPKP